MQRALFRLGFCKNACRLFHPHHCFSLALWRMMRVYARLLADLPPAGDFMETEMPCCIICGQYDKQDGKPVFALIHGSSAKCA